MFRRRNSWLGAKDSRVVEVSGVDLRASFMRTNQILEVSNLTVFISETEGRLFKGDQLEMDQTAVGLFHHRSGNR